MALKLGQISEGDLKFFAAHALSGLSSNPYLMSPQGKLELTRAKTSIEKIAMQSALEMISRIEEAKAVLDRLEDEEKMKEEIKNGINGKSDAESSPSA